MRRLVLLVITTSICLGCYDQMKHTKEAVLRDELFTLRQTIDQFTQDQQHAPESLGDLVAHGYMRTVPKDPFTESELTWQVIYGEFTPAPEDTPAVPPHDIQNLRGIIDVHSGSDRIATDGTRYRDW
ncbi:MAG TPA: hypothetical protein VJA94_24600 [Candidatus Angelobacter sp.]